MIVGYSVQTRNDKALIESVQPILQLGLEREAEKHGMTLHGDVYERRVYGNLRPTGKMIQEGDEEFPEMDWVECDPVYEDATYVRIYLESVMK